jgi:hypothetical protein
MLCFKLWPFSAADLTPSEPVVYRRQPGILQEVRRRARTTSRNNAYAFGDLFLARGANDAAYSSGSDDRDPKHALSHKSLRV